MVSTLGNTILEAAGDFFDNTLLGKNESELNASEIDRTYIIILK